MNEELGQEVVKEIGGGKTKFFEANVLETDSIAAAVKGALAWSKETGKEIGGVIAAAGVSTAAKVSAFDCQTSSETTTPLYTSRTSELTSPNLQSTTYHVNGYLGRFQALLRRKFFTCLF
jgi:hypothetical protein